MSGEDSENKVARERALAQAMGQIEAEQAARDPELRRRVHEFALRIGHAVPDVYDRTPGQRKVFFVMLAEFIHLTQMAQVSFIEEHELQGMIIAAIEWGMEMSGQFREEMTGFGFDPET